MTTLCALCFLSCVGIVQGLRASLQQKHAKALHAWLVALFVPVHSCSK